MKDKNDYWFSESTGSNETKIDKIIKCNFEKYTIEIALDNNNEFISVVGIKINQKYFDLSKLKIDNKFIDVDYLYDE